MVVCRFAFCLAVVLGNAHGVSILILRIGFHFQLHIHYLGVASECCTWINKTSGESVADAYRTGFDNVQVLDQTGSDPFLKRHVRNSG